MAEAATVHACAVLVGAHALLIRGPAGSGKSQLVLALMRAAQSGHLPFCRLVGDDRVQLEPHHGRLLARAPDAIAGMIEARGLGIRQMPHDSLAVIGAVVDLAAPDAERLPAAGQEIEIAGIRLPRLAVASGQDPCPAVLTFLQTSEAMQTSVNGKLIMPAA